MSDHIWSSLIKTVAGDFIVESKRLNNWNLFKKKKKKPCKGPFHFE